MLEMENSSRSCQLGMTPKMVRKMFLAALLLPSVCQLAVSQSSVYGQDAPEKKQVESNEGEAEKKEAKVEPKKAKPAEINQPFGQFVTVNSPIDDRVYGKVTNIALALENNAVKERKPAFLVLELRPGTSQMYQVQGLAKFLSSSQISHVTTVAWIPESVKGNNVVVALGCKEIVMHPDASLGDIGLGKPVELDDQEAILQMVRRRHNRKLSPALAKGMMDQNMTVFKIEREIDQGGRKITETQIVSEEEQQRLLAAKAVISNVVTIKERGRVGSFSGAEARALDVLAVHNAQTRNEVAELYNLPREAMREKANDGEETRVQLISINQQIDALLESYVNRKIERALAKGVNLLVFEIESPGGALLSSKNLAYNIQALAENKVRTVAYIPKEAYSGAAIIALGCNEIYMHADAQIGDSAPIMLGPGGQFEKAPEKILSPLRETLRDLAEKQGRPPAVAEAMADKDLLVYEVRHSKNGRKWFMTEAEIKAADGEWIRGEVVEDSRKDNLLTVNGKVAHDLLIAEPPVADKEDLKLRLGIAADFPLEDSGPSWVDKLVFILNSPLVMGLLLVLGILGIYLEMHFMTGLMGIMSTVCFAVFFWATSMGGTAGILEIVLFAIGLLFIALEIFVIPGFGVFGVSGGLLVVVSLVMASQTFGNLEPTGASNSDFSQFERTLGTLSMSLLAVITITFVLNRYLPKMSFFRRMVLVPPGGAIHDGDDGPRLRPELVQSSRTHSPLEHDASSLMGQQGVAVSTLRPAGKMELGGRYYDVVSNGGYITEGARLEVVQVRGNHIVVREAT